VSELQHQARALGDPTRYGIFRHVADAAAPVTVAELAAHSGVHHNAVRQHLARLVEAGLLVESTQRKTGRGRPRLQYTIDPGADSRWGVIGPYERLARWLSEVVRTGESPVTVGRRVGAAESRVPGHVADPGADPLVTMVDQMARLGFDPSLTRAGDVGEITLHQCPFASAAVTDPDIVCALHLGVAQGFADDLGGAVVEELVPTDPRRPRCQLRVRLDAGAAA
jgi:predicted ArsR family transcriptional regulator